MGRSRELAEFGAVYESGSLGYRNRIINGDCRIDQRNNGASVTVTANNYSVDRFLLQGSQTSRFTGQQNAGSVTPPVGFRNYLGITSSSAYSILSTDLFVIQQQIEGFNSADLMWGTANASAVTLSFWVRSSLTGTFGGSLTNDTPNRSYPFTYTISAANTWEYKTITVAGDTSGTWGTGNGVGIRVYLGLGVGSTLSGTAGAWAGSDFRSATGATSVVGTNGATFYITGVQLEAGTVATPFERVEIGESLRRCQRYYENGTLSWIGNFAAANTVRYKVPYKVNKRAIATVVATRTYADSSLTGVNYGVTSNETDSFAVQFTSTGSSPQAEISGAFTASAEL
jgi:hypothetical protein